MVGDVDPTELTTDVVDDLAFEGATVVELASGERSFRFGHVIVDEAQDLSAMEWRMVVRRADPGCITAVGDLAQRTIGPADRWADVLPAIGPVLEGSLSINYRSPKEVLDPAGRILASYAPGLRMPAPLRSTGTPTRFVKVGDVANELGRAVASIIEGSPQQAERRTLAVIIPPGYGSIDLRPYNATSTNYDVVEMNADECRGLEFDATIIIEPGGFGPAPSDKAMLFVAMTRATQWSAVVFSGELPEGLKEMAADECGAVVDG